MTAVADLPRADPVPYRLPPEHLYPSGDGKPMAETSLHVQAIMLLHQALEDHFAGRPDVFVASDIFWYPAEGQPGVSPDVMVVTGVEPRDLRDRRSFFTWLEGGAVPDIVFEMASRSTVDDDLEDKYDRYEELGVGEYVLFDPEERHLVPPLQVFRRKGTVFRRQRNPDRVYESRLGFRFRAEGTMLRLIDAATGRPIPTRAEAVAAAEADADAARQHAEATRQRADAERQRADAAEQRADALAAELARLREMLRPPGPSAVPTDAEDRA